MSVPLEQFVQQLEDSGILAGDTLADFIPPKASPENAEELVRELVRQNKLTRFQAEEVAKGNARSLVLGNYVLLEKIGAGGMGQVFKARHRRMDRIVAVKLLPAALTKDPAATARFEREVKAAARLSHPNIVTAHDADCANGVHFLVMECVEGSDLSALVKKHGPLPVEQAVQFILQAARGLEAAHEEGIVHRDIKPANLLLDRKGTVKILDMGLARIDASADEETQAELTRAGIVMGTVDYMAPEQARDTKSADARADIYSLGCTLHYLLTGKTVYQADTLMAKLVAHRTKPIPSLRSRRSDVPEPIDAVFQEMLAKDVGDRYQSMGQVIAALQPNGPDSQSAAVLGETQQFAAEDTHTGLTDFLQQMVIDPPPPVAARKPAAARKPLPGNSWLRNNRTPLLIGSAILGVLLLAGLIASLQLPDDRPTVHSNDFDITDELPRTQHTAAGDGSLAYQQPGFDDWVRQVAILPPDEQVQAVVKKLRELNPGFDGKEHHRIQGSDVVELHFVTDNVTDISPIRALASLTRLHCQGSNGTKGKLSDLSPLRGMPLTNIACGGTQVADLSPLQEMPLRMLHCSDTQVSDLTPLKGMPLSNLNIGLTAVVDLSPLKGMPLDHVYLTSSQVTDLSPLRGMRLEYLECYDTSIDDLSPLKGMPLTQLLCSKTLVNDLSPIKDMPLTNLWCDFRPYRDSELLRSIKSLDTINGKPVAEFWRDVEARRAAFDTWTQDVAAMPAEEQVQAVVKKLQELNPDFDGVIKPTIEGGIVTEFQFFSDNVSDLSPVRALSGLKSLTCTGSRATDTDGSIGKLFDLSPLRGMALTRVNCSVTRVGDLTPLQGMAIEILTCFDTPVTILTPLQGMPLTTLNCSYTPVADLAPLDGMPLRMLVIDTTQVADLSPLRGMPLTSLQCTGTKVSDLAPLEGMSLRHLSLPNTNGLDLSILTEMPLQNLTCPFNPYRDTNLLRSIKTLEQINSKPAADFWREVDDWQAAFDAWAKDVAALPAEGQLKAVSKKLQALNPGFDGKLTGYEGAGKPGIANGVVGDLRLITDHVTDISPLRALSGLVRLYCTGSEAGKGQLSDLWPLVGMSIRELNCNASGLSDLSAVRELPLTFLHLSESKVSDLSALQGLPITNLNVGGTPVSDLSALKGMPLTNLAFPGTQVTDLSPLAGMPLEVLGCDYTRVSDLSPLKGMPLQWLNCTASSVADLSPLRGMPLEQLYCNASRVTDLSPLRELKLKKLTCEFNRYRDSEVLRSIKSLETINGKPATEFWKEHDARQADIDAFIKDVAAMPAEEQVKAVAKKLQELNPEFDGKVTYGIEGDVVTSFQLSTENVKDMSPIRVLTGLKTFVCCGSGPGNGVADLSPLQGLPLTFLECHYTQVADLSPLRGMPLTRLTIDYTLVTDLSPLAGMPLTALGCSATPVTDLSPLKDLPLKVLGYEFEPERDTELLRSIKTLEMINGKPAAEFWKEVEGELANPR